MATKKNTYIEEELEWLEKRAADIKADIDANPYNKIEERIVTLMGAKGPADKVVATKDAQQKAQREALKDYTLIVEAIGKLREKEEQKQLLARGGHEIPHRMKNRISQDGD